MGSIVVLLQLSLSLCKSCLKLSEAGTGLPDKHEAAPGL